MVGDCVWMFIKAVVGGIIITGCVVGAGIVVVLAQRWAASIREQFLGED